VSYHKI